MSDKKTLRGIFETKRRTMTPETRRAADESILLRIRGLDAYSTCRALALFATDGTEPDLLPLLADPGKIFLFPRYRKEAGVYEFAAVAGKEELVPGKYGILEPAAFCPAAPEELVRRGTLHLVPGVSFDLEGGRLGRGGGFYDRLLAHVAGPVRGGCYACQISSEALPCGEFDIRMGGVVTEDFTVPAPGPQKCFP